MQQWFRKSLGDALLADVAISEITTAFQQIYGDNSGTKQAAVYLRHESEGRLQCEAIAYFTPASQALAQQLGACPCAQPYLDDLGLLVGEGE